MTVYQAELRIFAHSFVTCRADFLPRLRRGRPPYPRGPYTEVAERAIKEFVDASLDAFCDRVRGWLEFSGMPEPGDTVLEEICRPVYRRALGAKRS
jgi:hypothetical protein